MAVGAYPAANIVGPQGNTGATGPTGPTGSTGPTGPSLQPLTFTAKSADYTAVSGDFVQMTGSHLVSLPSPTAGRTVGVLSVDGTGAAPAKVGMGGFGGSIIGLGWSVSGTTPAPLGTPGAYVVLQADGTNWKVISGAFDTGWIALTFDGNYTDYGSGFQTCARRKCADMVSLRGLCKATSGVQVTTLPADFRISAAGIFTCWAATTGGTGEAPIRADVHADGTVTVAGVTFASYNAGYWSLNGITYSVLA